MLAVRFVRASCHIMPQRLSKMLAVRFVRASCHNYASEAEQDVDCDSLKGGTN
jgi:hypothetical protein